MLKYMGAVARPSTPGRRQETKHTLPVVANKIHPSLLTRPRLRLVTPLRVFLSALFIPVTGSAPAKSKRKEKSRKIIGWRLTRTHFGDKQGCPEKGVKHISVATTANGRAAQKHPAKSNCGPDNSSNNAILNSLGLKPIDPACAG